jgi:hypothetical protein
MRYLFVLLLTSISLLTAAQFTKNVFWTEQTSLTPADVVYYNPARPLAWKDFRGSPDNSSRASAVTASGFGYKADYKNVGSKTHINISVYCYFNKNNSWVKSGRTTDYILNHEQQHFDISFIAATVFVEKLKAASLTKANYNTVLPALYKECCSLMNKLQDEYDGQTKNGQLQEMQAKWNTYLKDKIKIITK